MRGRQVKSDASVTSMLRTLRGTLVMLRVNLTGTQMRRTDGEME